MYFSTFTKILHKAQQFSYFTVLRNVLNQTWFSHITAAKAEAHQCILLISCSLSLFSISFQHSSHMPFLPILPNKWKSLHLSNASLWKKIVQTNLCCSSNKMAATIHLMYPSQSISTSATGLCLLWVLHHKALFHVGFLILHHQADGQWLMKYQFEKVFSNTMKVEFTK